MHPRVANEFLESLLTRRLQLYLHSSDPGQSGVNLMRIGAFDVDRRNARVQNGAIVVTQPIAFPLTVFSEHGIATAFSIKERNGAMVAWGRLQRPIHLARNVPVAIPVGTVILSFEDR